ncbi:hypothetical protein AAG570_010828 [Ranatra chinensis]|uniref:Integrase catalytic domain-containing protein n=1 Tax=Ranatra chinensis TaxID=642074 RepID=A0ABD0YIU9_9HEMI
MRTDIVKHASGCLTCLAVKPDISRKKGLMGKRVTVTKRRQVISSDILGPFLISKHQNRYTLVVLDYFTKYTVFHPFKKITAKHIATFLEQKVFLGYGVSNMLIADNGLKYMAKEPKTMLATYRVKVLYNVLYHLQYNTTERINRVLSAAILLYVGENLWTWDEQLLQIGFVLRTAVHEVSQYSPTFFNFGCVLRVSGNNYRIDEDGLTDNRGAQDNRRRRVAEKMEVMSEVEDRVRMAYEKNKSTYNLRHRQIRFAKGGMVWLKPYTQSEAASYYSEKLALRY